MLGAAPHAGSEGGLPPGPGSGSWPSLVRSLCCLYFVATSLPWEEETPGALQAGGGGSTAPASRFTSPSPRPHAPCRDLPRKVGGRGGESPRSEAKRVRLPGPWHVLAPSPNGGSFSFSTYFV